MSKRPQRIYHYRGQVERYNVKARAYGWHDGYSENGPTGQPLAPWNTKDECRQEADKDSCQAVFKIGDRS